MRRKNIKTYLFLIATAACIYTVLPDTADAALPDWTFNGNAYVNGSSAVLTPNIGNQLGNVWYNKALLDLSVNFTIDATVYLGASDAGADGITFMFQKSPAGLGALGAGTGEWMGSGGIYPAIALEIDTYQNPARGDPACDHLGVDEYPASGAGLPNHSGSAAVCATSPSTNIENGIVHSISIKWDASTNKMTVKFDGNTRLTYTKDIVNTIFGGNSKVYFGYTGSTGGATNYQYVTPSNPTPASDIALSIAIDNATPKENDTIIFTIIVTNNGPDNATNMNILDLLPAGLTYFSNTHTKGSYNSGSGIWNVGNINNGVSETLTLTAIVDAGTAGTTIGNVVTVNSAGQFDPLSANNTASVSITVIVNTPVIAVTKTVDQSNVYENDTVIYTIQINNSASTNGTITSIDDTLPAGFSYITGTTTGFTAANPTIAGQHLIWNGSWTISKKIAGVDGILSLSFHVSTSSTAGTYNNVAVAACTGIAPVSTGNTAPVTVTTPSFFTTKQVNASGTVPGSVLTFSVYYHNTGTAPAASIVITDTVPANTTYVPGSMRIGNSASTYLTAVSKTDAADADEAEVSGTDILFKFNTIAADDGAANSGPDEGLVYFQATIN